MDYFDANNFGTGAQQRFTSQPAWGSGEMTGAGEQGVMQGTDLFRQQFRNLMGRDPTADELGKYQVNALASALPNFQNPGYGTLSGVADAYINNTFGPEIANRQIQTQTEAQNKQLDSTQSRVQDLVKSLNQNTQDFLTSPESQASIQGSLNNTGMLNSGAYSKTMAGLMSQGALQNQSNALQGVTIPALQNIQGLSGLSGVPYQNSMQGGQGALTDLNNIRDFNWQSTLAQMLADKGQPSGLQSGIGMASSLLQGGGQAAQGGAAAYKATSYICMELIKRGLLCDSDMDDFHVHIMPALFKKGRAFWKYAMDGYKLAVAVNRADLDWKVFKPLLFDRVMDEKDPCEAVDLYADACHQLCISSDPSLWDGRVMRTGFIDSLPFIPLLLGYHPFREALVKTMRIKMVWLYDKPACLAHRGERP